MSNDFDIDIPQSKGNYMKFQDGENKFRIMGSPITGWEYWKEVDGKRTPIRKRMDEAMDAEDYDLDNKPKHFWAFPVFNYADERIQILELTQKTVMQAIKALSKSKDWGDPKKYDIIVGKSGQKLETEYIVQPVPPKELDPAIVQLYKDMDINLEALFDGQDPFNSDATKEKFLDEVSKEIS